MTPKKIQEDRAKHKRRIEAVINYELPDDDYV